MHVTIHATRPSRRSRVRLLTVAAVLTAALIAGCGGGTPARTGITGDATTTASSAARTGAGTSSRPRTAAGAGTTIARPAPTGRSALAFAKCMRANGVSNFPDPQPGGGELFVIPTGSNPGATPAFRAAQAKCKDLLPAGGPVGAGAHTHPSAQTLSKLLRIAQCMRQHSVPQFPDPRTSVPADPVAYQEITDFDGAILLFPRTINLQSPAYRQALTACGAPPLGLPH